ncbi:DUF3182 family protein [Piscinibacter sp.]|uniref:DUF3182 family protein n=1 Tax=Piscinibacter sp. TaxID=1903157 RepID=UPI002C30B561|nr:DUF3182 family protein [Albitalea sp.]HUG22276.1 DUF3182 family protein [Albitalea sp.]
MHAECSPRDPRWVSFLAWRAGAREHELATQRAIAERLAALMGCHFAGQLDASAPATAVGYAVPNDTLTSLACARRFGIRGEDDLFGGVVPFPFVATKTITHPLVGHAAAAPAGWCAEFSERVREVVLPGHSAFSLHDARAAGRRLLQDGPVRIKLASGVGGSGQSVARDVEQLDAQLAAPAESEIASNGLVVERNLADVRTYSVGLVRVGALVASYFGTQRTTPNRHGQPVYGGSSLTVARGGFDALERLAGADADMSHAVALARTYHSAALACFTGMFASRANYDIAQGRDAAGRVVAGVLEQSWRIGGASGAEVAALQALRDDPSLDVVRACTVEVHAPNVAVPDGATLYFSGVDEHVGPITKYAQVHRHADTRAED